MTTPAELRQLADELDAVRGLDDVVQALRQAADALDKRDEELGTLDADIIVLKAELSRLREELSLTRNAEEVARAEAERLREERGTYMAALANTRDDVQKKIDAIDADNARLRRVVEAAKGLQQHGSDLRNGTHAKILWAALAALDQEKT